MAKVQHPFAVILDCVNSRVPPEVVFDQGLGDLFAVCVAGNMASDDVFGSLEFAVEEFGGCWSWCPDQRCRAVSANLNAMDKGSTVSAHIDSLVAAIKPVVTEVEWTLWSGRMPFMWPTR